MKNNFFKEKTLLITGASSGIGREFALLGARCGARLILTGRNLEKLEAVKSQITRSGSISCEIFRADLSRMEEVKELIQKIDERSLSVDVLINCSGFATYGYFHKLDISKEIEEIAVNVTAVVYLTHHFISAMVRRGQGWILNIASTASLLPCCPFEAVYGGSKLFISSFSLALAQEYRDKNIYIGCLLPGNTNTDFWQRGHLKSKYADKRKFMTAPAAVAQRGLAMIASGENFVVVDKKTAWKAFLMKFLPVTIVNRMIYHKHYDVCLKD